jgi:outer membrane protein OmpA-like peptidoglycan-associated protein
MKEKFIHFVSKPSKMKKGLLTWCVFFGSVSAMILPHSVLADPKASSIIGEQESLSPPALSPDLLRRPNYRRFNVRLLGGASFALRDDLEKQKLGEYGGQGLIGVDWVLIDPLAFSILVGYSAFSEGDSGALQDLFATAGFMVRLFADKNGAVGEKGGNAAGQLFLDAHFGYHGYENEDRAGYNIGIGYEFSLSKDFNLGPYFRFSHAPVGDGFSYMSASFGIQVSVGGKFEPDDVDEDGIEDRNDKCPLIAEDIDGFEDGDGCPDEDNDNDGILDAKDNCPNEAGAASKLGCVETDNDHDGIKNEQDACPDEAEDKDGFDDNDGCPDTDNDNDGIQDAQDKCPGDPEDKDTFEDNDGCPDEDNDRDGILDAQDNCPLLPETENEIDDTDGCPDFVQLTEDRIVLLESVAFAKNKAVIKDSSFPMLEEAAAIINLKPELKLDIEGHTDNTRSKKASRKLSERRAEAVKAFFVNAGVAENRLTAAGLGQEKPIEDNKTKLGREKNNRIELLIQKPESATPATAPEEAASEAPAEPARETKSDAATSAVTSTDKSPAAQETESAPAEK